MCMLEESVSTSPPNIINKFLGIDEVDTAELEVTDNQVCKEITANQVKVWPKKGKISSEKLSVKYVILNRIVASNWVPTTHSSDIATSLGRFIYFAGTKTRINVGKYILSKPSSMPRLMLLTFL